MIKICPNCKNPFKTTYGEYCSRKCFNEFRRNRFKSAECKETIESSRQVLKTKCKVCGREFIKAKRYNDYCSKECYEDFIKERKYNSFCDKHGGTLTFKQWDECLEHFNSECAYCGEKVNILHQEHFIAESKGGRLNKDNIIPACRKCNFSKNDKDALEWYKEQLFFNKDRLRKILKYLGHI